METNKQFIADLISNLSKEIPHKWRVQSFSKNKPSATVVAYIDARDGIDLLNKYAVYGWEREHYMVGNNTYCKVGVFMPDGSVQYRSDVGVESNTDGVKGEASDSFKRACVNWGIGGFLYELGIEYVQANEAKNNTNYPHCIDEQGKRIWDLTKYMQDKISGKNVYPITPDKAYNIPAPVANTFIPKSPDERLEKAELALNKVITDTKELVLKQKDFKSTPEGANFQSSASVADLVKSNDIDSVMAFYKFVTKK
jgi:hypothetical protein